MTKRKISKAQKILVVLTSVICVLAYGVYVLSTNIFQSYINLNSLEYGLFAHSNVIALRLSAGVMFLCILSSFQSIYRQRILMTMLLLFLFIALILPPSPKSTPFILGLSNVIFDLTEPWRQFYAPPALRASIEGITQGLAGVMEVLSVVFENNFAQHVGKYRHIMIVMIALVGLLFIKYSNKVLKQSETSNIVHPPESLRNLLTKYPYVFISCIFAGINTVVFSYTFLLAKATQSNLLPEYYQYALYSGGVIGSMIIGRFADKKGIFFMLCFSGCALLLMKCIAAGIFIFHVKMAICYYLLAFLDAGLSSGILTINISLIGERLCHQGIFRAFAISNFFFSLGLIIANRVYEHFIYSFNLTMLATAGLGSITLSLLCYFYKKEKHPE